MAQQLAFPGASGWGRWAKGARASSAPTVYHVTNLNDSGTGSLRDAVSQSNRIVVFDVSGVIKITDRMVFSSNLYVAGQTAPGEGITVYGNGVSFSGANNIICRYLRVRMGHGGTSGKDCAGVANGTNMIFDHCSFSWGLDETFSINPDGKGTLGNITLQNCIIGQGLMTHSAGGLMQADSITLYRNLYIDNSTRNNKIKGINQYANNVVYNWKNGCYIMGGDSEGDSYCNIESNLFVNGPAKGGNALGGGNTNFHFYADDNWQDANYDGILNPSLVTNDGGGDRVSTPYSYPELELYAGNELIAKNIPTVGASLPYRDQADCYMVDELMSFGTEGNLITFETSLPIGAPDTWTWWAGTKKTDTDGDGMPDEWESANGTDPSKADATVKASNGYLNIENYINSITDADREFFLRAPVTLSATATTSTMTVSWRDYTYAEDGFIVEVKKNGEWVEAGKAEANATSCTISGLEDGTSYDVRVRAWKSNASTGKAGETVSDAVVYSDYTTGNFSTRPVEVGILDIDSYQADRTLGDAQTTWNHTNTDWKEGKAFEDNNNVLLNTDADKTIEVSDDVMPGAVVVNGTGNLTVNGSIMGEGSMNKANTGTLVLNGSNTYTGATVNHEGVIEMNTIANGDAASSIGASRNFAQNWIFDGGTYKYTGSSASTDRSAQIKRQSTLNIANSNATITESGIFEGDGDFCLDGKGTLSIASSDFFGYNGSTILQGGILDLTDIEGVCKTFSGKISKMVMAGGHLRVTSKNEDYQTYSFPIEVEDGTTSQFTVANSCYVKNTVTGNGTLQFNIPYLRAYMSPNLTNFTGEIIGNGTNSSKSLFYHQTQWNAPQVRFKLTGTCYLAAWTTNATNVIGGLSGNAGTYLIGSSKQTSGYKCSWEVGGANSDETFNGVIMDLPAGLNSKYTGTVSISKVGSGLWRLTGKNTYSGTTAVNGGSLIVDGTHSGTGAVTVNSGATLKGQGTIAAAVTVNNGGILAAGDTIISGKKLTLNGAVSLKSGSTLCVPVVNNDAKSYAQNNFAVKTLTIADGAILELDMSNVTKALTKGNYFTVFATVPTTVSGSFATIEPAVPAEGLKWDTSSLFTDGKIYIVGENGESSDPEPETPKTYGRTTVYSWESPSGTVEETGGAASMKNAPADAASRVNYSNTVNPDGTADSGDEVTYYTLSLNGKYGNMNDATASNNSTYIEIDLDEAVEAGDSIWITAYQNKGTTAVVSPYIVIGNAVVYDGNTFNDIYKGGQPNTLTYVIPEDGDGSKVIKLTRGSNQGTNLFITKFVVTHWGEVTGIREIKASVENNFGEAYDISGRKLDATSAKGIYIMNGKKYVK